MDKDVAHRQLIAVFTQANVAALTLFADRNTGRLRDRRLTDGRSPRT